MRSSDRRDMAPSGFHPYIPMACFVSTQVVGDHAALVEALLHEALHSGLENLCTVAPVVREGVRVNTIPRFRASWAELEAEPWDFMRAFHAWYVYCHLGALADDALGEACNADAQSWATALKLRAVGRGGEIGRWLERHRSKVLGAAGEKLWRAVVAA